MTPAFRNMLMGGAVPPRVDLNFAAGTYIYNGVGYSAPSDIPGWTFTRATPAVSYAETPDGLLVPFSAGQPRIVSGSGYLPEESRTNVVLWNRDLTNAAWTKSSITAAKDQTGPDGVANSASSITATGANGTVLQAITLGSSARFQTARIKRITGSGTIQMTMDNGATWTSVTVTSAWTRVSIPTQTLANPTVGFRIVTSGDAVAVDFVQNENGTSATSDIPTTTASVTRANDIAYIANASSILTRPFTMAMEFSPSPLNSNHFYGAWSVGGNGADYGGFRWTGSLLLVAIRQNATAGGDISLSSSKPALTSNRLAAAVRVLSTSTSMNGSAPVSASNIHTVAFDRLEIGSDGARGAIQNSFIQRVQIHGDVSDSQLTMLPR